MGIKKNEKTTIVFSYSENKTRFVTVERIKKYNEKEININILYRWLEGKWL